VLDALGTWDLVVELMEAVGVGTIDRVGGVVGSDVGGADGSDVEACDGPVAPAPAQPATTNETTAAPARERAVFRRGCSIRTHASEPNNAKNSMLGMMAW
jgi:outer membrane lipoprotein SlyB